MHAVKNILWCDFTLKRNGLIWMLCYNIKAYISSLFKEQVILQSLCFGYCYNILQQPKSIASLCNLMLNYSRFFRDQRYVVVLLRLRGFGAKCPFPPPPIFF